MRVDRVHRMIDGRLAGALVVQNDRDLSRKGIVEVRGIGLVLVFDSV